MPVASCPLFKFAHAHYDKHQIVMSQVSLREAADLAFHDRMLAAWVLYMCKLQLMLLATSPLDLNVAWTCYQLQVCKAFLLKSCNFHNKSPGFCDQQSVLLLVTFVIKIVWLQL